MLKKALVVALFPVTCFAHNFTEKDCMNAAFDASLFAYYRDEGMKWEQAQMQIQHDLAAAVATPGKAYVQDDHDVQLMMGVAEEIWKHTEIDPGAAYNSVYHECNKAYQNNRG